MARRVVAAYPVSANCDRAASRIAARVSPPATRRPRRVVTPSDAAVTARAEWYQSATRDARRVQRSRLRSSDRLLRASIGDPLEHPGRGRSGEEPAKQLRKHDRRKQLHCLELGAGSALRQPGAMPTPSRTANTQGPEWIRGSRRELRARMPDKRRDGERERVPASRSNRAIGITSSRSRVPIVRSRSIATDVITNMRTKGKIGEIGAMDRRSRRRCRRRTQQEHEHGHDGSIARGAGPAAAASTHGLDAAVSAPCELTTGSSRSGVTAGDRQQDRDSASPPPSRNRRQSARPAEEVHASRWNNDHRSSRSTGSSPTSARRAGAPSARRAALWRGRHEIAGHLTSGPRASPPPHRATRARSPHRCDRLRHRGSPQSTEGSRGPSDPCRRMPPA